MSIGETVLDLKTAPLGRRVVVEDWQPRRIIEIRNQDHGVARVSLGPDEAEQVALALAPHLAPKVCNPEQAALLDLVAAANRLSHAMMERPR